MIRTILQSLHLFLLLAIPVSITAMQLIFGKEDSIVKMLGVAVTLAGVAWAGIIVVYSIVKGNRERVLADIWNSYRGLLCSTPFLIVSVTVFIIIESFLVTYTASYRSVEIWAEEDVTLYLNDEIGNKTTIGKISRGKITKVRLKIGTRHLAYQAVKSGGVGALPPVDIPYWFSEKEIPEIRINKAGAYEKLY